jgi:hypothetical protein
MSNMTKKVINGINFKSLYSWICDYKSFLPCATKDNYINNHKNGWFGHKLQMSGLESGHDSL